MSEHYDFHYQPTGSGAISGQQVLKQTEDAINELGDYVNDNVGGAMDVAQQALETAQNAETNAQTALDTANSFSGAIQSAQQDASTALSTAQTAQTTASNANNTAIQASQDASSAVTTANNASGQVSTLSGTVTALGQRVTTAEGNIGQNTSDITALTTRVGTAEGNITTLQNDVSIAQGNASSAMATAGTVKQQSYVLRYSSTAVTDNSTIAFSTLDNTDNIKSGDKVIDVDGKIFSVVSVDTANQTVTVGTALIDLALDGNVVHTNGDETVGGKKELSEITTFAGSSLGNEGSNNARTCMYSYCNRDTKDYSGIYQRRVRQNREQGFMSGSDISQYAFDVLENQVRTNNVLYFVARDFVNDVPQTVYLTSQCTNRTLGSSNYAWSAVYSNAYYYGNIEFSNKFVTTDTDQDIGGNKTLLNSLTLKGGYILWKNDTVTKGTIPASTVNIYRMYLGSAANYSQSLFNIDCNVGNDGTQRLTLRSAENVVNGDDARLFVYYNPNRTQPRYVVTKGNIEPYISDTYECGTSVNRWSAFNGLEPSALSMPDLSNGVDISSYLSVGASTNDSYTASVNGYIGVIYASSTSCGCYIYNYTDGVFQRSNSITDSTYSNVCGVFVPILKNQTLNIASRATENIVSAKFFPCLGNV